MLWSAVGSSELVPEVLVTDCDVRDRTLLCSDGLTKHVGDEEIRDYLARELTSEAMCKALLELALSRGGTDNITIVSGRVRRAAPAASPPVQPPLPA